MKEIADFFISSAYNVTFDRSLENCVVHADAGSGDPADAGFVTPATPTIVTGDDLVTVVFTDHEGNPADTSFMISAFC